MTPRFYPLFTGLLVAVLSGVCLPAPAPPDSQPVRIRFWNSMFWGPPQEAVHELTQRFNESQSRIRVEVLDVPSIEQKLFTAAAGGVPPELALFDRFRVAAYAERGAFTALDDHLDGAGIRPGDFFPTCWDECVYRERVYAIPFNTDVRVLFYNREKFREAGLDPDRPPRTWAELREYSKQLTRRDARGNLTQIGFVPTSGAMNFGNTWFYLYGWQNGGEFMSADGTRCTAEDPKLVEALEWVVAFIDDYNLDNLKRFGTGFGIKELDPFLTGKVTMVGEEGFLLSRIRQYKPDLDFGVAPLPWPESGRRATWSGGFALVIPNGCRHPEETLEFVAYLTGAEAQAYYGQKSEQIPANEQAARTPYFLNDPRWRVFIEEMEFSRFRPVTAVGPLLWDELARAVEIAYHKHKPPAEALRDAQRNVQVELDRILAVRTEPLIPWGPVSAIIAMIALVLFGWRAMISARRLGRYSFRRREALFGYLFAAPVVIGLLTFTIGPILVSAIYSFCMYEVLTPARWIGWDNYKRLFAEDPRFWKSLWNTLFYTVFSVPLGLAASLGLALLLNAKIAARSFFRTLFYVPSIVPIVAASMLWLWLFNGEFGLFNVLLSALGLPTVPWLTDVHWAKPSLVLMSLWGVGAGMIIFLAGLQGIPGHLYEAAVVDGAGPWQRFLNVTLPMLSPTIFFMLIINTIGAFQIFTQAYLMTNGQGTPLDSTLFYVFYLFRMGFEYFSMGYASALAWIMFLIILAATLVQFYFSRRWVHSDSAR